MPEPATGRGVRPLSGRRPAEVHATVSDRATATWPSSRNSHARARIQSRFTVAGDESTTLAVSSIVSPAKNRMTTRSANRASIVASLFNAFSRSRRSTSRGGVTAA